MHRNAWPLIAIFLAGSPSATTFAGDATTPKLTPAELAARIDEHVAAKIKSASAVAAPPADDAELVRRLHLDLAGRIPEITAARDFIESPGKDKRLKLIDSLLDDPRYSVHWANVWRQWLLGESADFQGAFLAGPFEGWLREQLKGNARYDRMVRDMVVGRGGGPGYINFSGPGAFLQASQFKPESIAANVSRLFLGVKLECAQCHDHPAAKWKRKQFWEMAAFFTELGDPFGVAATGRAPVRPKAGEIKGPGTDKVVKARFVDGEPAEKTAGYRAALVDWMTAKDNPYFAKAAVNRVWEHLLGVGLVEPVDEESADNPPSHPELLSLLARQFTENGHDLKYLVKAIVLSEAYGRTSRRTHKSQADGRLFARMPCAA